MDYIFVNFINVVDLPKGSNSGNDLYAKVKCGSRVKITNVLKMLMRIIINGMMNVLYLEMIIVGKLMI